MKIPFTKAHGARNDFLLTWREQLPPQLSDFVAAAVAICERNTGVGADGWLLMSRPSPADGSTDGAIELWNSDGSRSEISGNGTRCAASVLVDEKCAAGHVGSAVRIVTGAGLKHLRLLDRDENKFSFEMNMGRAHIDPRARPRRPSQGASSIAPCGCGRPPDLSICVGTVRIFCWRDPRKLSRAANFIGISAGRVRVEYSS
jgi:diaminopimelate epimerase